MTLASSVKRANTAKGTTGAEAKSSAVASQARHMGSKGEKPLPVVSSGSDVAAATTLVPPTDPKPIPAQDSASGQDDIAQCADGSTTRAIAEIQFAIASPELTQQLSSLETTAGSPSKVTALQPSASTDTRGADDADPFDAQVQSSATDALTQTTPNAPTLPNKQVEGQGFKLQMELPVATMLPDKGNAIQTVGKPAQKNNPVEAAGAKSAPSASLAGTANPKATDPVGAAGGASTSGGQDNGGGAKHSEADSSHTLVAMSKVADAGTAQTQPISMHTAIREVTSPSGTLNSSADVLHSSTERNTAFASPLSGDEVTPTSGINAAKLVQALGETEMHVGMQSAEFGNVSIRTLISQQQMQAQISVDHSALGQAIAASIPTMQAKLGVEYGLQTSIQVNHQGGAASGGQGSPSQRDQQGGFTSSARSESVTGPGELDVGVGAGIGISPVVWASADRLDIRA